jgi:hypothetical protein
MKANSVSEVRTVFAHKARGSFNPTPQSKNRQFDLLRAFPSVLRLDNAYGADFTTANR